MPTASQKSQISQIWRQKSQSGDPGPPRCVQTCWHSCFIQASKCGCAFGGKWSTRGCCPCEAVIF